MMGRAQASGVTLNEQDAALIKGMLRRGDRQHDIAAWFGVNGGRIAEIATDRRFADVECAEARRLPPVGPYPKASQAIEAIAALAQAKAALSMAENKIRQFSR
jgi:hypothetical protein